ncbi:MAG: hypothetical protein JRN20_05215, partial [Nitrososphaerota archaeon]|nr:hypothetical protein [Nitrososphaerota archaeon]
MFIRGRTFTEAPQARITSRGMSSGFSMMASSDISLLIKALIVSGIVMVAPLIAYGALVVLSTHLVAIAAMSVLSVVEFALVQEIIRRRR